MATEQVRARIITEVGQAEFVPTGYFNPAYYDERFLDVESSLRRRGAGPLDRFIPELHPDGEKGITYGQVGARKLDARGSVRYLQVINIRDTGIDFAIKPDRVAEGGWNDPRRSRVSM